MMMTMGWPPPFVASLFFVVPLAKHKVKVKVRATGLRKSKAGKQAGTQVVLEQDAARLEVLNVLVAWRRGRSRKSIT